MTEPLSAAGRLAQRHWAPKVSWIVLSSSGMSTLSASILLITTTQGLFASRANWNIFRVLVLDAGGRTDHENRRLGSGNRGDGRTGEVGIAGRIDQVDELSAMLDINECRLDRMLVLLLFVVVIANAGLVVNAPQSIDRAGLEEYGLGQRCLAAAAMFLRGLCSECRPLLPLFNLQKGFNDFSLPAPKPCMLYERWCFAQEVFP